MTACLYLCSRTISAISALCWELTPMLIKQVTMKSSTRTAWDRWDLGSEAIVGTDAASKEWQVQTVAPSLNMHDKLQEHKNSTTETTAWDKQWWGRGKPRLEHQKRKIWNCFDDARSTHTAILINNDVFISLVMVPNGHADYINWDDTLKVTTSTETILSRWCNNFDRSWWDFCKCRKRLQQ